MAATKSSQTVIARGTSNAAFTQLTGCSVTRSSTTATLTKTSHGRSNGDKVLIQGFALEEFNGIFTVANAAANTFDYTIKADPGANPSGTTGTVDLVTLGTALDLSAAYGGKIFGGIQNGNSAPGVAAQVWLGTASSGTADADYQWRLLAAGDLVANSWTPFSYVPAQADMYVNIAVARNTTNAVDCYATGVKITAL
jgi:hypothetical protein